MEIYKIFKLDRGKKQVISFVGGGGKTTTIFGLARELSKENKKILISTTTKIFNPKKEEYDYYFLEDIYKGFTPLKGTITILGEYIKDGKLIGVSSEKINEIADRNLFDFIFIEADGSKRKPIKAPASHEPIIPEKTTITIGVIGLDSLNKPIDENIVHRPDLLKKIPGNECLEIIDEDLIINLVLEKEGLFKNGKGKRILFLNKVNETNKINAAKNIKNKLKLKGFINTVIGDVKEKIFY